MNDKISPDQQVELMVNVIDLISKEKFEGAIAILDKVIEKGESPFFAYQFRSVCYLLNQEDSPFSKPDAMRMALRDAQSASGILIKFLRQFPDPR